jgi:hypothetical protein
MSLHPVINRSEVFNHFLSCEDHDTLSWKAGKRKHERDEYRGSQWLCTIHTPPSSSCGQSTKLKEEIDKFSKVFVSIDSSVRNLINGVDRLTQTHARTYKKDLSNMGKKFEEFGSCLSNEVLRDTGHGELCKALMHTGVVYGEIANLYGEQAKQDAAVLIDNLSLYRGILQNMPEVVHFNKVCGII